MRMLIPALICALFVISPAQASQWHGGGGHFGGGGFHGGFGGGGHFGGGFHGGGFGGFHGGGWGGQRFFGGGWGGGYYGGDPGGYAVSPPAIQWQCNDAWGNFLYWGMCDNGN